MSAASVSISPAQRKALKAAADRPTGCVCPVRGVWAAAETALLDALARKGLVTSDPCPRITDAGREAIAV